MTPATDNAAFTPINRGYNSVFRPGRLTLGLVVPIESYPFGPVPEMTGHIERVRLAESLGFSSVWLRDVPFNVPSFGDVGQIHDPFVYLGLLAGLTEHIALGVASIILPLRHPAHVAKAAASADVLSGGRLILGVATGDRPDEYPALNKPFEQRGKRFRESFEYIRRIAGNRPDFENPYGNPSRSIDLLPKPVGGKLPLLVTGEARQSPEWIAANSDGWMIYPRDAATQADIIRSWNEHIKHAGRPPQPVMQSLYIDLTPNPDTPPQPIHLGFRSGSNYLRAHLKALESAGVNHVALNLRFNREEIPATLKRLADEVLPHHS